MIFLKIFYKIKYFSFAQNRFEKINVDIPTFVRGKKTQKISKNAIYGP